MQISYICSFDLSPLGTFWIIQNPDNPVKFDEVMELFNSVHGLAHIFTDHPVRVKLKVKAPSFSADIHVAA